MATLSIEQTNEVQNDRMHLPPFDRAFRLSRAALLLTDALNRFVAG